MRDGEVRLGDVSGGLLSSVSYSARVVFLCPYFNKNRQYNTIIDVNIYCLNSLYFAVFFQHKSYTDKNYITLSREFLFGLFVSMDDTAMYT